MDPLYRHRVKVDHWMASMTHQKERGDRTPDPAPPPVELPAPSLFPGQLILACAAAGLSLNEAARLVRRHPQNLAAWAAGVQLPAPVIQEKILHQIWQSAAGHL